MVDNVIIKSITNCCTSLRRASFNSSFYIGVLVAAVHSSVWESVAAYKEAASNVGIQARLSNYPVGTVASPHLFKKVAVPGICIE
jgi:hypothetical protein